jgi:hyperosmotically inducible periplasmic protein
MSHTHWVAAIGLITLLGTSAPPAISVASAQSQKPSDATLKERIAYRLETDPALKPYDVKVKVDMGIAMLSGTVATSVQKAEAAHVAKIDGVNRVESDIVVNPDVDKTLAEHVKSGLSKTGETITDGWITTKVKWFFVGEDLLKGSDIKVDTSKHVVTLKGTVKSAAGRARAMELARQTEGVEHVVDALTVVK